MFKSTMMLVDGKMRHMEQQHSPTLNLLFSSACLSVKSDSAQRPGPPRGNPEDHGSLKAKNQSPNVDKDKAARKKSSDSGEEADKEFILV